MKKIINLFSSLMILALMTGVSGCAESQLLEYPTDKSFGKSLSEAKAQQTYVSQSDSVMTSKEVNPRFKSYTQGKAVVSAESDQIMNKSQGF